MRSAQAQSSIAQQPSYQPPPPPSPPIQKPGLLKSLWFWFLVLLATLILVFGFLPFVLDGRTTFAHWVVAGFWLVVIHYALKKLFPSAKT